MMAVESMKKVALQQVSLDNLKAEHYGKGYYDGFSDGYDKALENTRLIIKKYNLNTVDKPQERELKPAIRFLHQSREKLIEKIVEECDEVVQAFNDGECSARIAEELADVQEACETMMSKLGYHEKERRRIRLDVIKKNGKRGYYMPQDGTYGD